MIHFHTLIPGFSLSNTDILKEWLGNVILKENKMSGDLNFIFCSDDYLLEINSFFLQHNYYTDILTFPTSENPKIISGEIYLSIDRVKENAIANSVSFKNELKRVLVHGVLHLLGYTDDSLDEISLMRSKEDNYLLLLPEI
ncbi:MAG TPA: rRNA maturation RNase YbeY [Bacteroidales bacterium]